jgi:hypothetical protein
MSLRCEAHFILRVTCYCVQKCNWQLRTKFYNIFCYILLLNPYFCGVMSNLHAHTKQIAFHAITGTGVYAVCFDLFRYLNRRGY